MRARHLPLLALALPVLGGCGGDDATPRAQERPAPPTQTPPAPGGLPPELLPPNGVPTRGDGSTVEPGDLAVIRRWAATLRRGDVPGAARLFALPSRFQNGTPVLDIDSPRERLAIHASLTCGATVERAQGARGYVVTTFRFTERPGGDCAGGVGGTGRCAIRVEDGRIVEFYRLPEGAGAQQVDPGEAV
jgi:hypothetical protein